MIRPLLELSTTYDDLSFSVLARETAMPAHPKCIYPASTLKKSGPVA